MRISLRIVNYINIGDEYLFKHERRERMNKFKRLGWVSFIFLAFFLLVSLPQAQSAEATGNAPIMVAAQEATIPLGAKTEAGSGEAERPYTLTFKLAAVALHREDNKSQSLIGWGGAHVGAGDLDLGWAPGMDTSIMLQNRCYGVELRYLGLTQWSESKTRSDYYEDYYWYEDMTASGRFKSRLHNAELNFHWWPYANDRYSLLAGFRWLRLTDTLSGYEGWDYESWWSEGYYSEGGKLSCRNQFWGGQVGVEGLLFGKRDQGFSINGGVKAGIFANKIKNKDSYRYEWYDSWYGDYSGSGSYRWNRTKTSFLSEVGVNLNYAFTRNIAATVGYEFLYLGKVAVPVNNWASTQSVIFQGGRLGVNLAF